MQADLQKTTRWLRLGQRLERSGLVTANAVDSCFKQLGSSFALGTPRARVVNIVDEAPGVRSFWLRPNALLQAPQPGQYLTVIVEVDGVRHSRCYSVSSLAGDLPLLRITVKLQAKGVVSTALHQRLRVGDLLDLGDVGGALLLPPALSAPPLFIAAGSGITPIRALLEARLRRSPLAPATLIQAARHYNELIFDAELSDLQARYPALQMIRVISGDAARDGDVAGRLTPERLLKLLPNAWARPLYLCGPAAFMQPLLEAGREANAELHHEYFAPPRPAVIEAAALSGATLTFAGSGKTASANGEDSLLAQAEAAGLKPAYGCRMGICNSCTCRKVGGAVRNLLTGEIDDMPDRDIRICISAPAGDVTLDL